MTRMAQERDSILRIRAKVDSYDELEESRLVARETPDHPDTADDRIRFCSVQKAIHVKRLARNIFTELSIQGFTLMLAQCLQEATGENVTETRLNISSVSILALCSQPAKLMHLLDPQISFNSCKIYLPHECIPQVRISSCNP
jgi:hypothetical protein